MVPGRPDDMWIYDDGVCITIGADIYRIDWAGTLEHKFSFNGEGEDYSLVYVSNGVFVSMGKDTLKIRDIEGNILRSGNLDLSFLSEGENYVRSFAGADENAVYYDFFCFLMNKKNKRANTEEFLLSIPLSAGEARVLWTSRE